MLQSARAFVSSSWQPQLVLYCSGLCHGAMPHCVSHDLFACCEAAPLCPGTAKLSARTQLERDGVHPPDFSGARRRVSSVRRWSLQLSRQRGEPGALHSYLPRQPYYTEQDIVATTSVVCNQCCRTCIEFHTTGTARGTAPKRQYPTTTNKGGTLETHTTRVRAGTAKGRLPQRSWVGVNRLTRWALDNAPALSS